MNKFDRRDFLKTFAAAVATYSFTPSALAEGGSGKETIKFGLITDVHQDVMHDASQRVTEFGSAMNKAKADFVCQLGDFCVPHKRNVVFMEAWNKCFDGPQYHIIGNHDTDEGFRKKQLMDFWEMDKPYYSADQKNLHIVVLDGNEAGGSARGYKRYISKTQLDWLRDDLEKTQHKTVVFIHQPIDGESGGGIENHAEVRKVLEEAKDAAGNNKVIASFCGHNHDDFAIEINGIHHIRINSSSYVWLGGRHKAESYSKELHKQYRWLAHVAPYEQSIWAEVEVDLAKGSITVKGKETTWVGKDPWERGVSKERRNPETVRPSVSDRKFKMS